jgi:NlpC/P60 family/Bacterial dipeptidyl-peptidase Sh3 domain
MGKTLMSNPPRSSFSLTGPSISLDPRVHAVRGDLADIALAGQLFAPHYARPMPMRCSAVSAMLHGTPSSDGKAISQLLYGEDFMVVDISAGWAWGYCRFDHYVGYVPEDVLCVPVETEVSAMVAVPAASLFESADANADRIGELPMGAMVRGNRDGDFVQTPLGFVHRDAVEAHFADAAAVAEQLIETPYVWGGRSGDGIDCSGLIQLSLALTGQSAPRDSDQQQHALGEEIAENVPLQRGDIIFFPGHVGIMADHETLIHATMHYGKTVREKLCDVIARVGEDHETPVLARKRISQ